MSVDIFVLWPPIDFGPIEPRPWPPDPVDPESDHEHMWACTRTCIHEGCEREYDGRFDALVGR